MHTCACVGARRGSAILLLVLMRQSLSLIWSYNGCLQAKESFISAPNGAGVSGTCTAKPDFARGHCGFEPKHSRLYSINILTHLNSPQQLALSYFLYLFLRSGGNHFGSKNLRGLLKIPALEQTCPLPRMIVNLGLKK